MGEHILKNLWDVGHRSIRVLESEHGILASGKEELYGCLFGRDSLITGLKLLDVYQTTGDSYYLSLVQKILRNLAALQGERVVIESGEEPGKIIHEFRPDQHEHLTVHGAPPWHVYENGVMRNYDTADATPLFLMTAHEYLRISGDHESIHELLPHIHAAIDWMRKYGDSNGDGFLDYHFHPARLTGGLRTQSWMDSHDSVFFEETEETPEYPIAPVEVQAYAYNAYRVWSDYFAARDAVLAEDLKRRAAALQSRFNAAFLVEEKRGRRSLAFAIDGAGRRLLSPRSSMGHCLFAAITEDGSVDSILAREHIPAIVRRLLAPDLYVPRAGIRTLSMRSRRYDANSYHNGSIWPHDTALIAAGFEKCGYHDEARRVRRGLVRAYAHFNTPLELFVYAGGMYQEYCGTSGQRACRVQAWSAASLLSTLTKEV